jgi:lon-related putative ATP-dependent protease
MTVRSLTPSEMAVHCTAATLDLDAAGTRADEPASPEIVGQERARAAVEFAVAMRHRGYHLFVTGPPGSGKRSLARRAIDAHVALDGIRRYDWVYVNNFERPHQPIALQLAAGRGAKLRADMRALVDELRTTIPAAFESEEYAAELERLNTDFKERTEGGLIEVGDEAQRRGLVMIRTPVGFTFAPQKGAEVMSPQDFEALSQEERTRLQQAMNELQEQLVRALRASMRLRKEHADRLRTLNRATTKLAVDHVVDETKLRYADVPTVGAHLEAVRTAVIENAEAFRVRDDGDTAGQQGELARYEVNLVVDAGGSDGATIVEADLPTVQNLVGRIDHIAHFGMLVTDFRHIKAGLLHRANGGYLLIDAIKLLTQPFAWSALKRALLRREIRIESLAEMFSMVSTIQLEPQPIPLDIKVVLVGEREICQLLQTHDPEFDELFRVVADLGDDLPRGPDTQRALAQTLASQARARGLLPTCAQALARVIDHGARRSGDATRLTASVRHLLDVLHEADHLARGAQRDQIAEEDIAAAIGARRERARRIDERLRDAMLRDILAISTAGEHVGQVNGLAAYQVGDEIFGVPARITATTRLGDGQVIDIQRETQLGGPVHAKGVLILSSFLAARYSRFQPHSIIGSLVFEQTYGLVEGDSASLAELIALLTSIGDVPVRQSLAMTGSVDQFGNVQAIGAVNEKVEGFFDLCVARGLDGTHGVVIPESNVAQLMLRADVIAAVANGRFALHAVGTVDDALEVLTGLAAGDAGVPSDATVNGRIAKRLREYTTIRRGEPRFMHRRGPRGIRIVSDKGVT